VAFPANYEKPELRKSHPLERWIFLQDEVWVDAHSNVHEIAAMPLDYVANVVRFCEELVWRIDHIVNDDDTKDTAEMSLETIELTAVDLREWFSSLPLLMALKRKLALATIAEARTVPSQPERVTEPLAEADAQPIAV
jgi:hypothetical protein